MAVNPQAYPTETIRPKPDHVMTVQLLCMLMMCIKLHNLSSAVKHHGRIRNRTKKKHPYSTFWGICRHVILSEWVITTMTKRITLCNWHGTVRDHQPALAAAVYVLLACQASSGSDSARTSWQGHTLSATHWQLDGQTCRSQSSSHPSTNKQTIIHYSLHLGNYHSMRYNVSYS